MADVKEIVKEMLQRGMSESDILSTLADIGIPNGQAVLAEAQAEVASAAPAPAKEVVNEQILDAPATPAANLTAAADPAVEAKLDEALAMLHALEELNKKILETNRDILLRVKENK